MRETLIARRAMDRRKPKMSAAMAFLILFAAGRSMAATFMVENTEDFGLGTLRQAILSANLLPGPDAIHFNIPGPGPHTIVPQTELPPLLDAVTIDGTTQPGFSGVPLIALNGDRATFAIHRGFVAGLRILGGNSTVRGLMIYSFGSLVVFGTGIYILGPGNNVIEGNYLGLTPEGLEFAGNSAAIECIGSINNRIGGPHPTNRNVISYNFAAIIIKNGALLISSNNLIQGNFIGTDPTGSSPMPNLAGAVLFFGGQMNQVLENRIAFNDSDGINITSTNNGNTISGNLIYGNSSLGINLQPPEEGENSLTPNDDGDSDSGPNALQNFPVITSVRGQDGSTVIAGHLPSTPNRLFRLEFFRSTRDDASGFGEGEVYLGSTLITTDAAGIGAYAFTAEGLFPNQYFTATATDHETGNTSEFSQAVQARPGAVSFELSNYVAGENAGSAAITVLRAGGTYGDVSVEFSTDGGTAVSGADFVPASGTLSFKDGENAQTIVISLVNDPIDEDDEDLTVRLSAPEGALLGPNTAATLLIVDDDPGPNATINDIVVTEGASGEFSAHFVVRLSSASSQPITVSYATADGTAHAGSDYQAAQGTLNFPPGQSAQLIPVSITGDQANEPDEIFFVNLTGSTNATLADNQAQCVIRELRLFIARLNRADLQLRFPTGTGQSYTLEHSTALNDPVSWLPLPGAEMVTGTGEFLSLHDTLNAQAPVRFYRVRMLLLTR